MLNRTILKVLQNDIDAAQSAFKEYLIPFSFEMNGRNAHILRKGTSEGLAAFKAACRKNGATIGIALFAAVHWAIAKFDSSRDPICFADVNLRHRVSGDNLDKESEVYFGVNPGEKSSIVVIATLDPTSKIIIKVQRCELQHWNVQTFTCRKI